MRRLILLPLLALGCGFPPAEPPARPAVAPAGPDAKAAAPLSPDQQSAWAKLARQHREHEHTVYYLGYFPAKNTWKVCTFNPRAIALEWNDGFDLDPDYVHGTYKEYPQSAVEDPAVKAVAEVDVFGGDVPKVVRWLTDDGKGVKETKEAPAADLDASLKAHLRDVQTRADQP